MNDRQGLQRTNDAGQARGIGQIDILPGDATHIPLRRPAWRRLDEIVADESLPHR